MLWGLYVGSKLLSFLVGIDRQSNWESFSTADLGIRGIAIVLGTII